MVNIVSFLSFRFTSSVRASFLLHCYILSSLVLQIFCFDVHSFFQNWTFFFFFQDLRYHSSYLILYSVSWNGKPNQTEWSRLAHQFRLENNRSEIVPLHIHLNLIGETLVKGKGNCGSPKCWPNRLICPLVNHAIDWPTNSLDVASWHWSTGLIITTIPGSLKSIITAWLTRWQCWQLLDVSRVHWLVRLKLTTY